MSDIYFNDREGQTVLSHNEKDGLLLKHITNLKELDEAEQANIQDGLIWLSSFNGKILSESFWRKLHKKLFGSVWKWAGKYRKSEKNIGVEYWKVPTEVKKLIEDTKYWIKHKSYEPHEIIAHFHHRLVETHPFPNGNGRFARILTKQLCLQNNWPPPSWGDTLPPEERRKKYINALRAADIKNYKPLIEFVQI